jgi:hypothetical protein
MSSTLIRGVLLAGRFRTQRQLNTMSPDDQRNTLIVELAGRSNQANFQSLDDDTLAGAGAVLVFLREARIRDDRGLKAMTIDDMRNTLIVEIGAQTGIGRELQGLSNLALVHIGLGKDPQPGVNPSSRHSYIRGVMLVGQFRTQHQLNTMSNEDMRNTLIVELAGRTNQSDYQSFDDFRLAGTGAALVFLRHTGIRDDRALRAMTADDIRNTLIVEIGAQTGRGRELQGLSDIDLVSLALGGVPVSKPLPPPLQPLPPLPYVFQVDSLEVRRQKADNNHSDSDWLSLIVTVIDRVTQTARTLPTKTHHLEGNIKTGDVIAGVFATDPFEAGDTDIVIVNYLITNLGSSDAEDQFAEAVKITNKVVGIVGPIAGAAVGLFFGAPGDGLKIGKEIAGGVDKAISVLGEVFDFLGIHAGPPNCNGVVLHDTLTYQSGELLQAVNRPSFRDYTGPQEESRCGSAPESRVNFSVRRGPAA